MWWHTLKVIVLVVLMHCGVETRAVQDGAQTPLYQMVDNSTAQSPTYERIRIQTTEDLDKLYALIRSYVLNPSLAETVKDVHIDTQDWPAGCYCRSDLEKEEQEHQVLSTSSSVGNLPMLATKALIVAADSPVRATKFSSVMSAAWNPKMAPISVFRVN